MAHIINIEEETSKNENFRKVLYTTENSQLVLMSLKPGEDIGEEVHDLDQFIRIEKGMGRVVLDDVEHEVGDGFSILVPKGTKHNLINISDTEDLKLYTLYAPPAHRIDALHRTKEEALEDKHDE